MRKDHVPLDRRGARAGACCRSCSTSSGLPLRSAIDVVVFAIACMGLNILVGHTGLVSFGHGAWFGLGAYAAALSQRYWFPGDVILPALFAMLFVAVTALLSGALILRRRGVYFSLLTLGADRAPLRHRLSLDRVHRRRKRARRRHPLDRARPRSGARLDLLRRRRRARHGRLLPAVALSSFAGRQRAGGDPRERGARPLHRLSDQPLQAHRLRAVRHGGGGRRHAVGVQSSLCLGRATVGGVLGRAHRHGGDRRDAKLPRAGARRPVLHPVPRIPVDLDAALAVLVRPVVRRLHRVLADRSGRRRRGADRAVSPARGRGSGHGRPHRRRDGRHCRRSIAARPRATAPVLVGEDLVKRFGGIHAVDGIDARRQGPHLARADRSQRRRQDHGFQLGLRPLSARPRHHQAGRPLDRRPQARETSPRPASAARSRSPICLAGFRSRRTCGSPCRRAAPSASPCGARPRSLADVTARDRRAHRLSRTRRHRARRGRLALLWRPAPARHGACRWRPARASCCSTSRSPAWRRPSASASPR